MIHRTVPNASTAKVKTPGSKTSVVVLNYDCVRCVLGRCVKQGKEARKSDDQIGTNRYFSIRKVLCKWCYPNSDWTLLLLFSHQVRSDSLWPHELKYAGLPRPSLSPRGCSNSCPQHHWTNEHEFEQAVNNIIVGQTYSLFYFMELMNFKRWIWIGIGLLKFEGEGRRR